MKNTYLFFILCCLLCTGTLPAQKKLTPTDDTYVYSDGTIRGMETLLKTYHSTAGSQYRRISFLKFDISTLSPFLESVKLRLYTNGFLAGGDNAHQFDLYPVNINSWAEDDITFLNYKEKVGDDVNTLLASFSVAAGEAFSAQYIEFSGANLTQMVTDSVAAGKRYISFRLREKNVVKNGANAVIVEFHSKEHESGFSPELLVAERDTELYKAGAINMDGQLLDGFSEDTYYYNVRLSWDETSIPEISATAKYPEGSVIVKQAVSLTGSEDQRMAVVTITNGGVSISYKILFDLLPPPTDASLANIFLNGESLEFFSAGKFEYLVYLPYSENTVPVVSAETNDPNASAQVTQASEIVASSDVAARTATIAVKSANNEVDEIYSIVFEQLPELDIVLAIGQSNMAGRAPFSDVADPMEDIFLLTPEGGMEISSNPMNKYSNVRKDLSVQGLGPSYTCALKLQQYLNRKIGFVVNAQGGSSILSWYQPGKSNYDATIIRAKEAWKYGKIKAVIWHQGESDKGSAADDNYVKYKSNLASLVNNLRTDLNEPDLYFVCGELSQLDDRKEFNAEVIQKVASYITDADYVSTEGTSLLSDGTHFDASSVKLLGERYAEKLIEKVFFTTSLKEAVDKKNNIPLISIDDNRVKLSEVTARTEYQIFDLFGRVIEKGITEADCYIALNKGFYLITLCQGDCTYTRKIFNH